MDEVYISGALTAIADGARARVFYELLAEIVSECGLRPYLPHQATDPVAAPELDPASVYEIDRARVARSGLLIAYAGTPSFGVGIEVEIARERGIPVILVAERERTVSRILLGSPAVVDVVRFTDLAALRRSLGAAIARVTKTAGDQAPDAVVQRFLGSLGAARQLPAAEVAALLRVAELDGDPASQIRRAIADGKLFGAGLRDLVGRHALRGASLAAFILHDILERPFAEIARTLGADPRAVRRSVEHARARLQLAADADGAVIGQWLVTELIAPPTRALQLRLFANAQKEPHEQRTAEAEDHRQAGLAVEEGEPRA
ncbi:MAG TPA: sigma factor-like helix-turn-helix DNA-binding protein [Candidatus Limnocylindria bacterium]|nr:sigma factor-like helix-turn-helix DNA-binding protein [Candidatus Limnocylindria bacterium]